jgi:hypothetical protein
MSIAVAEPAIKVAFKETAEYEKIQSLIKKFRDDFDLARPLLNDESDVIVVQSINEVLHKLGAEVLPLELMATTLHYKSLAIGGRQLSLKALVEDLIAIALTDPGHASLAAYFIGRSMEKVAVNTLLYQSEPARYQSLVPTPSKIGLNVMAIAAGRLETIQSEIAIEKTQASNCRVEDVVVVNQKPEATIDGSTIDQSVAEKQLANDGSDSLENGTLEIAINTSVSTNDSTLKTLNPDLNGVSDGQQEAVLHAPSESVDTNSKPPQNPEVDSIPDLFEKSGNALTPLSTSTKPRKNRKKSF